MSNWMVAAAACLLAVSLAGTSRADEETKQCLRDARGEARLCRAECRENFRMDKDECRSIDHDCAEVCREDRNECLVDVYGDLESCRAPCADALASSFETCRLNWPPHSDARERCVKRAKLQTYRCNAECRSGVADEIKECRVGHRDCGVDCREDVEDAAG